MHQDKLFEQGINVNALIHRPESTVGELLSGEMRLKMALEATAVKPDFWRISRGFVDAILEDTLTPSSWNNYGPLPSGIDGLRQTQAVCAIVESAETGKPVSIKY